METVIISMLWLFWC